MKKSLILASKSPRRNDILTRHGFEFSILVANFNELDQTNEPVKTAVQNAYGKAMAVFESIDYTKAVVLGADTVVCLDGEILGKPKNAVHAKQMLETLSGKTHEVVTGYAIISSKEKLSAHAVSTVTFNDLTPELIEEYVNSGLPLDKAGAYGIQDGYPLVKSFNGSFNNIVGLPIEEIKPILNRMLED